MFIKNYVDEIKVSLFIDEKQSGKTTEIISAKNGLPIPGDVIERVKINNTVLV